MLEFQEIIQQIRLLDLVDKLVEAHLRMLEVIMEATSGVVVELLESAP